MKAVGKIPRPLFLSSSLISFFVLRRGFLCFGGGGGGVLRFVHRPKPNRRRLLPGHLPRSVGFGSIRPHLSSFSRGKDMRVNSMGTIKSEGFMAVVSQEHTRRHPAAVPEGTNTCVVAFQILTYVFSQL